MFGTVCCIVQIAIVDKHFYLIHVFDSAFAQFVHQFQVCVYMNDDNWLCTGTNLFLNGGHFQMLYL